MKTRLEKFRKDRDAAVKRAKDLQAKAKAEITKINKKYENEFLAAEIEINALNSMIEELEALQ